MNFDKNILKKCDQIKFIFIGTIMSSTCNRGDLLPNFGETPPGLFRGLNAVGLGTCLAGG